MIWRVMPWTEFENLSEDWERLAKSGYSDHPLLDTRLICSALTYFANDDVRLLVSYESRSIASIAILSKKRASVWETFAPSQLPFSLFVTVDPQATTYVVKSLSHALPGIALLVGLRHFDERYSGRVQLSKLLEKIEFGRTMDIQATGKFEDYWASRSKNLRKSIRRYERKLGESHGFRMEIKTSKTELPSAIKIYGDMESAGWKGKHGSAVHEGNVQGRFYCSSLLRTTEFDGARVFLLYAGEKPIASRLAIVKSGIMVILKTTYDEAYAEFAPGRVLLKCVLQYAFEEQAINVVEFYTKATEDQLRWASSSRLTYHYNYFASRIVRSAAEIFRRF